MTGGEKASTVPAGPRYELIDAARGLSILLMVVYHFAYDLAEFGLMPAFVVFNPLVDALQLFFSGVFIFMSGASSRFSKNNVKRGVKLLIFAAAVTFATWLFDRELFVVFGILHFLGAAALVYAVLGKTIERAHIHPLVWIVLFVVSRLALSGTFPVRHLWFFGIVDTAFTSSDYFPFFPWIFVYLAGSWFGAMVLGRRLPAWFYEWKESFFSRAGRLTLIIYLVHQPVLIAVVRLMRLARG